MGAIEERSGGRRGGEAKYRTGKREENLSGK